MVSISAFEGLKPFLYVIIDWRMNSSQRYITEGLTFTDYIKNIYLY